MSKTNFIYWLFPAMLLGTILWICLMLHSPIIMAMTFIYGLALITIDEFNVNGRISNIRN